MDRSTTKYGQINVFWILYFTFPSFPQPLPTTSLLCLAICWATLSTKYSNYRPTTTRHDKVTIAFLEPCTAKFIASQNITRSHFQHYDFQIQILRSLTQIHLHPLLHIHSSHHLTAISHQYWLKTVHVPRSYRIQNLKSTLQCRELTYQRIKKSRYSTRLTYLSFLV